MGDKEKIGKPKLDCEEWEESSCYWQSEYEKRCEEYRELIDMCTEMRNKNKRLTELNNIARLATWICLGLSVFFYFRN